MNGKIQALQELYSGLVKKFGNDNKETIFKEIKNLAKNKRKISVKDLDLLEKNISKNLIKIRENEFFSKKSKNDFLQFVSTPKPENRSFLQEFNQLNFSTEIKKSDIGKTPENSSENQTFSINNSRKTHKTLRIQTETPNKQLLKHKYDE